MNIRTSPGAVACLVIALLAVVVYSNVGQCDFIDFDDDLYVSENTYVRQGLTWLGVKWACTASHASTWQPLVWLSYMVESELLGENWGPSLFHWTNLVFHVLNAMILFLFLRNVSGRIWESFTVSLLFTLHPVHVESVAWVAERKDVLSTFFWMLTLLLYSRYVRKPGWRGYLLFMVFMTLGLMSKPMLITIPFVLLLLDYWPMRRIDKKSFLGLVIEKIPLLIPVFASAFVTFFVQREGGSVVSLDQLPISARIANAPVFYLEYVTKLIWPVDLAVLYPHPGLYPAWRVASAVVLLVAVSAVILKWRHDREYLVTGWLWFLGTLVPVIGLVQIGLHGIADRFVYVPSIGLYLIVAWMVGDFVRSRRISLVYPAAVGIVLILLLGVLTYRQTLLWKDNITLFSHTVNVTENNWGMHNSLGATLERKGDLDGAFEEFRIAASINPNRPRVFYNMGCALHRKGLIGDAIEAYRKALALHQDHLKARFNLACALEQTGRLDEAAVQYGEVLRIEPGNVLAHNNMGNVHTKRGQLDRAAEYYRKALDISPDYINARYNLGTVLMHMGKLNEAREQFAEVLTRNPDYSPAKEALLSIRNKND